MAKKIIKARGRVPTQQKPAEGTERECHDCKLWSHWRLMHTTWDLKPEFMDDDGDHPDEHHTQRHECIDCLARNLSITVDEAVLMVGRKITQKKLNQAKLFRHATENP